MRINTELIERARREKGLCIVDVARMIRVTPSVVSRVESGTNKSARTVKAIADALGLSMEDIIIEDRQPTAQPAA